jgi:hypothetical protein
MLDNAYTPRLSHSITLITTACLLLIVAGKWGDDFTFSVCAGAAALFIIIAVVVLFWLGNRERIAFYDKLQDVAEAIRDLEPNQWQALGIAFPTLRIRWNGTPLRYIEDTDITQEELERFIADSTDRQISPERNWSNGRDRRTWLKIKTWLEGNEWIIEHSAAGSHSWLWKGNVYYTLRERYCDQKTFTNLNASKSVG